MAEQIVIYHESAMEEPVIIPRDVLYAARDTDYREYFISVVDILMFTPDGNLIFQRRGKDKKVSPNLLHTTVGGHVNPGEDVLFTITHECMEEFGFPCFIVPGSMSFSQVYEKLRPYNDRLAVVQHLKNHTIEFWHEDQNGRFFARDKCHDFVGVFNGTPNNLDHSVEEFVTMSLQDLDERLASDPSEFTKSFQAHYAVLRDDLISFAQELQKIAL